ncbi:MAG: CRISPR-associated helicase Cas3' [Rhodobacteraceae bacterium]|nr:CRISPR-associated helicase Cas3' [Paracoccaceae bacterium]
MRPPLAHTAENGDILAAELLVDHSSAVSCSAAGNAGAFGTEAIGEITGWLHDLGKMKPEFQAKLLGAINKETHSGEGARYAFDTFGPNIGKIIAYCIAGHHTGLPNGKGRSENRPATPLSERINQAETLQLPDWMSLPNLAIPGPLRELSDPINFRLHFFTRMLFSALVDADFIETERYYSPNAPRGRTTDLAALRDRLIHRLGQFPKPDTQVNRLRAEVLNAAGDRAKERRGLFSLTVPTGGGKTLSSLRFALDHAVNHGMRRVIYVVPYSAIIEQTADVFRHDLQDEDAVLEHHTAYDFDARLDEAQAERMKLAAQNWDRPIIVTTAVQFFESLFANRTQKCRKLHNIANSVIVLDEAQTLPINFLLPSLAALKELARGYGCTVVFCTATQPAIFQEDGLTAPEAPSKADTIEIAPHPAELYEQLKRVEVHQAGAMSNDDLAARLHGRSALVILNNKKHARKLYDALQGDGVYHLTTAMTGVHRRDVLQQVAEGLKAQRENADAPPILLFSTSLVEAGVDLDFPEVWRAIAGLDSIAQAAGRCNREGRMNGKGQVYVFEPEADFPPPPELQQNAEVARAVLHAHPDPLTPEAIIAYFKQLYWDRSADLDAKAIMARIAQGTQLDFPFADIAADFKLIGETTVPLIIGGGKYGLNSKARDLLRFSPFAGAIARKMQPYSVSVPPNVRNELVRLGAAEVLRRDEFGDQFVVLNNERLYDEAAGFSAEDPEDLGIMIK